jgi:hypothetical protein
MRLASFEWDFWQLRSGEASHRQDADTDWISPLKKLRRGQAPS